MIIIHNGALSVTLIWHLFGCFELLHSLCGEKKNPCAQECFITNQRSLNHVMRALFLCVSRKYQERERAYCDNPGSIPIDISSSDNMILWNGHNDESQLQCLQNKFITVSSIWKNILES